MNEEKTIIEINGVKLEVDLRNAKRVDQFKVGDPVKVLVKEYGNDWKTYPGIIVEFYMFKESPALVIAYLKNDYSDCKIEFKTILNNTEGFDFCPMAKEEITINRETVLAAMERKVLRAEEDLAALKRGVEFFTNKFSAIFNLNKDSD